MPPLRHRLILACTLVQAALQVAAQPHPLPLINRTGTGVKPNVVITLDDSRSMAFQHMPEGTVTVGRHQVASPAGAFSITYHPDDRGPQTYLGDFWIGTLAAVPGSDNWRQKFMRSPDTNTLYYNPEVRYRPWARADGSRHPPAVASAAALDPFTARGTVDLTRLTRSHQHWCYTPLLSGTEAPRDAGCRRRELDHAPGLYYRLRRDAAGAFLDPTRPENWLEFDVNTAPVRPKAPARSDCAGAVCTRAEEQSNFAHWFVYHRSRLLLAKSAVGEVLARTGPELRVGYGRIGKSAGAVDGIAGLDALVAGVRDFDATRRAAVIDWLYGLGLAGGTPLRRAMQGVGRYFSATSGGGPWADEPGNPRSTARKACRRSYHVLVTDGYWNDDVGHDGLEPVGNVDGSDGPGIQGGGSRSWTYRAAPPYADGRANQLADYAMHFWKNDLQPDLDNAVPPTPDNPSFWQNLTTFTVGLGVRGTLDPAVDLPALAGGSKTWTNDEIDDLWHAALNSRGQYFAAQDPGELMQSLQRALRSLLDRELRDAGVVTASTTMSSGNRKYVPRYRTGAWVGDIDAFSLDENGQAGTRVWSASQRLPAWSERRIVTWDASRPVPGAVAFDWSVLSPGSRARIGSRELVDYVRGDRSQEQAGGNWRVRQQLLGDFINSPPVFARASAEPGHERLPALADSYRRYLDEVKARRIGVLYVGGNAGMLHAFRDSQSANDPRDGQEVFAYVPGALLGQLRDLADRTYGTVTLEHRYFVDGPLREADVHVPAAGETVPRWRNFLLGSAGAGGRVVFALDITEPERLGPASVRWELSAAHQPELGYIRFPIQTGQLPNGEWVALFGNGTGGQSGEASLFIVNLASQQVHLLPVQPGLRDNGLGGVGLLKDANGQVVAAYAGDLRGNVYRFDYAERAEATGFFRVGNEGQPVFAAGPGQAVVQAPLVSAAASGRRLVVVGTGQLLSEADARDATVQAIHSFLDDGAGAGPGSTLTPAQLAPRALALASGEAGARGMVSIEGVAMDPASHRGWTVPLALSGVQPAIRGLRVVYPLQRVGERTVFVSAVAPGQSIQECDSSDGRGLNLLLPLETGLSPEQPQFDTNLDGSFTAADSPVVGYLGGADGVDAVVARAPPSGPGPGGGGGGAGGGTGGVAAPGCLGVSIHSATGQVSACVLGPRAAGPAVRGLVIRDRAWRRLLTPPF